MMEYAIGCISHGLPQLIRSSVLRKCHAPYTGAVPIETSSFPSYILGSFIDAQHAERLFRHVLLDLVETHAKESAPQTVSYLTLDGRDEAVAPFHITSAAGRHAHAYISDKKHIANSNSRR